MILKDFTKFSCANKLTNLLRDSLLYHPMGGWNNEEPKVFQLFLISSVIDGKLPRKQSEKKFVLLFNMESLEAAETTEICSMFDMSDRIMAFDILISSFFSSLLHLALRFENQTCILVSATFRSWESFSLEKTSG